MVKRACPKVVACLPEGQMIRVVGRAAETLLMLVQKGSTGVRAYDLLAGHPSASGPMSTTSGGWASPSARTGSHTRAVSTASTFSKAQ